MEKTEGLVRHRTSVRWTVRLVILCTALILVAGGPFPAYVVRLIPAMSPLAVLSSALADRVWDLSLIWSLPALLVLGLGLWKGRFFCRWICPLGTLYSIPFPFRRKHRFFPWRLNGFFFWLILFASAAGLPLFLFLDPLSTFTRFGALAEGATHVMAWIPGLLLPLMLLLSLIQPGIWCAQLCPLGFLVEKARVTKRPTVKSVNRGRRDLLAGLAMGVPLALLFRYVARAEKQPVLPPGARNLDNFVTTCIRCYACVSVCPTKVLTVRKRGGVAELCIPEMDFLKLDGAYCEQYCHACTQVCPTGAISGLSLEEKQQCKIATASILREACLAWEDHLACVACDEFCGYNAIEMRTGKDGIPKPIINPRKCRGCGACQNICPAIRQGNAVGMDPVFNQESISASDDASTITNGCDEACRRRHGHGA